MTNDVVAFSRADCTVPPLRRTSRLLGMGALRAPIGMKLAEAPERSFNDLGAIFESVPVFPPIRRSVLSRNLRRPKDHQAIKRHLVKSEL
jgi:hypothetical protein